MERRANVDSVAIEKARPNCTGLLPSYLG